MVSAMVIARATETGELARGAVAAALSEGFAGYALEGALALVIIPDGTRTAPIALLFALLGETLGQRAAQLDYLIALGTHQPMSDEAIAALVGMAADERAARYPRTRIFNHQWDDPAALATIGVISRAEAARLTDGLLTEEVPVTLNRLLLDYDHIILCGPVFPHEVAGFSGGAKYLFAGIAGPDIINFTHWLGALATSLRTIGVKDTPVRRIIHQAAALVPRPILNLSMVMQGQHLHGLYIGSAMEAWSQAADLSA